MRQLKITKQVPDTLRLKRKAESAKWFSIVKVVSAHCISYCLCHRNHKSKIGRILTLNSSEGPIKFVLPRNTVSGQTFCLRGGSEQKHIVKVLLS